jgi:uncharacterized protein YegJ (DUF2314 family)
MIRAFFLSLALASPVSAQDPVTNYAEDDPVMNAAIAQARVTLPLFLANAVDAERFSLPDAGVKIGIPTVTQSGEEHIWVSPFRIWEDGTLSGFLANAPADLGPLREGDQVDFIVPQISDWSLFTPEGKMWGNYTSRVMYTSGAFGDTPFDQLFMADPVPSDWK